MKNEVIENFIKGLNLKKSNTKKYNFLRVQLDNMKYIQSFDEYSIDLVETLLNEVIKYKNEILKLNKTVNKNKEYIEELTISLNAFKFKSESILKENKDLHSEIIKLTEKFSKKDSNTETQLYQLKDDNTSLKYIISDLKKQLKQIKTENNKLKDNYSIFLTGLFEKSINVRQMYLDKREEEENNPDNPHSKPMSLETFESNFYSLIKKPNIEISENLNDDNNKKFDSIENYFPKSNYYPINTINDENKKQIDNLKNELKSIKLENSILQKQMLSFFNYEYLDNKLYLNDNSENHNFNNNNPMIIDFLRNELRKTKEKYESYIEYFMNNKNEKVNNNKNINIKNLNEQIEKISEENKKLKKQINDINYEKDQIENEKDFLKKTLKKELDKSTIKKPNLISKNTSIQFLHIKKKDNSKEQISKLLNDKKILEEENSSMKKNIRNLKIEKEKLNSELMYNNHQIGELIDKCNLLNKSIYEKNINSLNNNEMEEKNKKLKEELDKTNCSIEDIKRENESKQNLLKHELLIKDKEILRLNEINKMLEIQIQMFNTK